MAVSGCVRSSETFADLVPGGAGEIEANITEKGAQGLVTCWRSQGQSSGCSRIERCKIESRPKRGGHGEDAGPCQAGEIDADQVIDREVAERL